MDMRELTITKREGVGKGPAKRLRRDGRVPAILYGGATPMSIAVAPKDILRLIHGHEGSTQLFRIAFDGGTDARMAIIRDLQFDPVTE
jgi:large subunit ribosomal protein L25